jgi:hypothetical protein
MCFSAAAESKRRGGRIGGFLFSKSYINPEYSSSFEQNGATDLQRIISRGL